MDNQTEISKAVNVLIEELSKDKSEGSYYYSWQANIAMSFLDSTQFNVLNKAGEPSCLYSKEEARKLYNDCARKFLDLLCKKSEPQTSINNNE